MTFTAGQKIRAVDLQNLEDALDLGTPVTASAAAFVSTTSTTYVALTGNPGVTFTAAPSGQAGVVISSLMDGNAAGVGSQMSFELRTGGTIGSGTVVYAADDGRSIKQTGTEDAGMGITVQVSGLTPGSSYNVRAMYKNSGVAGTAGFANRMVSAIPVPGL